MRPPLVVWQFTDGKPGHESQTRGLIAALRRRADVHAYPIDVAQCRCGIASLLRRRHPCKFDYPRPTSSWPVVGRPTLPPSPPGGPAAANSSR